jgi:hypothetical protein
VVVPVLHGEGWTGTNARHDFVPGKRERFRWIFVPSQPLSTAPASSWWLVVPWLCEASHSIRLTIM